MDESRKSLYVLLTIHTVRGLLDTAHMDISSLAVSDLLPLLGKSIQEYETAHHYASSDEALDSTQFRYLVASTGLKRLISLNSDDHISLDQWLSNFKTVGPEIVAECSMNYSDVLLRELDDLKSKYLREVAAETETVARTDSMDIEPEEPSQVEEQKDTGVITETSVSLAVEKNEEQSRDEEIEVQDQEGEPEGHLEGELEGEEEGEEEGQVQEQIEEIQVQEQEKEQEEKEQVQVQDQEEKVQKEQVQEEQAQAQEQEQAQEQQEPEQVQEQEQEQQETEQVQEQERNQEPEEQAQEQGQEAFVELKEELQEDVSLGPDHISVAQTPEEQASHSEAQEIKEESKAENAEREARKRPKSPVNSAQKRKRFQNIAVNLVKTIEEHRYSSPFLTAVSAKNYEDVIYEPKDLKSILKNIKLKDSDKSYDTVKDLERDIMLMFANCVMFNKSSTPLVGMAQEMKDDVRETFKMFEEAESQMR